MTMLKRFFHSSFFWPVLLLVLIIPTFSFLIKPGLYWNMHDDMQLVRQLEMDKCLKDGQIPCRWTPDLGYGYGYPLFNFYPPLPYLVGEIIHLTGFSYVETVKIGTILLISFSALAMYLLGKELKGPFAGFLAGLFYTYAPYHAMNIFVRGAFNEAWASLFFPLILLFSYKYFKNLKNSTSLPTTNYSLFTPLLLLSLSWAGLFLSHNPMALTFVLFFAPWCLYWYLTITKKIDFKIVLPLVYSGLFALTLSAFFTLPVLFESKLTQIESMFENYYHYGVHFLSIKQLLFSNFWGDGPSVWGYPDAMSFSIGYLYWLIPLIILIFYSVKFFKNRSFKNFLPILIVLLGFFGVIMTHERFSFLWIILSPIQKIQFPWRFLNHSLFFFSLSFIFIPEIIDSFSKKLKYFILPVLVIAVISLNYKFFFPISYGPLKDAEKFSGLAWTNQITSGIYDYLPKTASTAAKAPAKEILDAVDPADASFELLSFKKGTNWWLFNLKDQDQAKFTLSTLYFPNFEIYDNNQLIDYEIEPELGRIVISLSPGEHQIYLRFVDTPIRKISNYISLFAWIYILVYSFSLLWKTKKSKI